MDYIIPQVEVIEVSIETVITASQDQDLALENGGDLSIFEL